MLKSNFICEPTSALRIPSQVNWLFGVWLGGRVSEVAGDYCFTPPPHAEKTSSLVTYHFHHAVSCHFMDLICSNQNFDLF